MSTPRPPAGRTPGWVIGRVAGAPVILAPSWLVAVAVLTLLSAGTVRSLTGLSGSRVYVVALAFVVLLFASVFLHELAHGLVAKARGQQPQEFVLTLWGGHTAFGGEAPTAGTTALVAAVGPLVNLLLAAVFTALLRGHVVPEGTVTWALLWSGAVTNGFVGVFNLIPGLPLDGGRVLAALVWAVTRDQQRGTVVAGWVGRFVAVATFAVAIGLPTLRGQSLDLVYLLWSAMIAAFLWAGAGAAIQSGRTQRRVSQLTLASVGHPAVGVAHDTSVAQAGAYAASVGASEVVLLSPDGRPAAYVDRNAAAAVPAQLAGTTPLTDVSIALPSGAVVDGSLAGAALVQAVALATQHTPVVVAMIGGRVAGLVRATDVIAAIRT
jgi:Zn-dependent protease